MGNAFAEFAKGLDSTTRNLPQMLMFAQQRDEQRQARNREIELKLGQERIQMGFKLAEMMKGNPEGQKEALMKFVVPGFQSLSKGGAVSYSEDEITKFVSSVDLSNKMGQNLINSLIKISSNQDMPAQEKLGAFNVALSGYQGELSKTQFEGVKGMGEQLKEEVNPKTPTEWQTFANATENQSLSPTELVKKYKNLGDNQPKQNSLERAYASLVEEAKSKGETPIPFHKYYEQQKSSMIDIFKAMFGGDIKRDKEEQSPQEPSKKKPLSKIFTKK